jgi:RNA polymerase sigma factor (TIGR02999 family)
MSGSEITTLLQSYSSGNPSALDELMPVVYDEMHKIARGRLSRERPDHTYSATALVHEAYLKLADFNRVDWKNRSQFFGFASQVMRNVLVNYAEKHRADKRGGNHEKIRLHENHGSTYKNLHDILSVDQALKKLEKIDERQARVVECRFFGGLTIQETADTLGISEPTVSRDWNMARAWLNRELGA